MQRVLALAEEEMAVKVNRMLQKLAVYFGVESSEDDDTTKVQLLTRLWTRLTAKSVQKKAVNKSSMPLFTIKEVSLSSIERGILLCLGLIDISLTAAECDHRSEFCGRSFAPYRALYEG